MTILYAWNTLNAYFHGVLKGKPRDVSLLVLECEKFLKNNNFRVPFDIASGH